MKRIALALSFCLMAFGPMPLQDLLQQDPLESFDTTDSPVVIIGCIFHGEPGRLTLIKDEAAKTVHLTMQSEGQADFVVSFVKTPTGVHIYVRRAKGLFHLPYDSYVKPCLDIAKR